MMITIAVMTVTIRGVVVTMVMKVMMVRRKAKTLHFSKI